MSMDLMCMARILDQAVHPCTKMGPSLSININLLCE